MVLVDWPYNITKLSRHDPNFTKKIAGQKGYLDQYDRLNDEEKLALYQNYEIDLIIDDTAKLKAENEKLETEKSELEESKKESLKWAECYTRQRRNQNREFYTKEQVSELLKKELDKFKQELNR